MSSETSKELTEQREAMPCKAQTRLMRCAYPESIGWEIVERLAAGESLLTICDNDRMPDASQVCWWFQGTVDNGAAGVLSRYYAQARAGQADYLGQTVGFLITDQASAEPTRKHQNARVAMDGARWYLGRLGSMRWQEPTQRVEHKGHISLSHLLEQVHGGDGGGTVLDSARSRVIEGETVEDGENLDK